MHNLYRLFDTEGNLLYIGVSMCPLTRSERHRNATPWFADVRTITIQPLVGDKKRAHIAEADAILKERPKYNVNCNWFVGKVRTISVEYLKFLQGKEKIRERMGKLRVRGWTYQRIADQFGVTRQRVHQIVGRDKCNSIAKAKRQQAAA